MVRVVQRRKDEQYLHKLGTLAAGVQSDQEAEMKESWPRVVIGTVMLMAVILVYALALELAK